MRRLLVTLAAAFALSAISSSASLAQQQTGVHVAPLRYHFRQLANGLRVYAMPDPSTATVAVQVWYNVGSEDDPTGRSGFAHLFEHMMFKGTRNLTDDQYFRMMEDVGGTINASTHADYTNYYDVVPANYLQRTLWAEAERMGALVVNDEHFASEREVVKEELRQRVLASPYGRLFYLYNAQVNYNVHPYGRPGIGSLEDLDAATGDEVRRFHATFYRPDNAVMVVAGNFDEAQFNRWVDQYFGAIARPERPIPRVTAVEPEHTSPRDLTAYAPNVPLPAVLMSYPGPSARDPGFAAFVVMDEILSTGTSARLNQALVYDQQLASSAGTFFEPRIAPSAYSIYAIMNQGKDVNDAVASLNAEIARLRDAPVSAEELERAKTLYITAALQQRETAFGRSNELEQSVISFGDPEATNNLINRVQGVSAADVQAAARRWLNDRGRVTLRYLNDATRPSPNAGDQIATAPTLQTRALTIPISEVPTVALAPEGQRVAPPAAAAAISPRIARSSERTLANGMRVIVAPVRDLPLTAATMLIRAGETQDPNDRAGVADLVGSLVSQGTTTMTAPEIARRVESLGGSLSSVGSLESSYVQLSTRSDHTDAAFAIFADVVRNPSFTPEDIERQRQQQLNGFSVTMSTPGGIAATSLSRILYPNGSYGLVNTPRSLHAITRDDIVAFHRTYWRPDNAILVIVGDISAADGFAMAQRHFGNWTHPAAPPPSLPNGAGAPAGAARTVVIDLPHTGQAAVAFGVRGVSRTDPTYLATELASSVLGGGFTARLNQEIRVRRGLSYGATASIGSRFYPAPFTASAQTRNDAAPQVADLIAAEFERIRHEPVGGDELAANKASLIGEFGRSVETRAGLGGQLVLYSFFGMPLADIDHYVADVDAVTPAQVQAAAQATLDPARTDIVIAGDASLFYDALHTARPNAERIPATDLNLDSASLR